jgi:shikimate kinase
MTSEKDQHERRSIALIGLRGSGKSVVAREIVKLCGGEHVDTDDVIAGQAGRSITTIFADEGEAVFRRLEKDVIAAVVDDPPAVISLGGGAVLDRQNVDKLKAVAALVWLRAPADVLWRRVSGDPATARTRPPLTDQTGIAEIEQLLVGRSPLYEHAADLTIDTADRTPPEVAKAIIEALCENRHQC